MLFLLQQQPIVVEVLKQPEPARDIGADVVLGMFALAGALLLLAAVGGLIVGAIFIGIRRLHDALTPPSDTQHIRLRI